MRTRITGTRGTNRGFTLLEGILALAVFTMSAVALTEALVLIGLTSLESREFAASREIVRSQLIKETLLAEMHPGKRELIFDEAHLKLKITVEELQLSSIEGEDLSEMYRIVVDSYSLENNELIERAETYRYQPLFGIRRREPIR